MKRTVVTAGVLGLLGLSSAFVEDAKIAVTSDRISLFEVALRCEAAPEIGCGSRSKPVLLQLEREPMITEAWLNESGTVLAVVGRRGPAANHGPRQPGDCCVFCSYGSAKYPPMQGEDPVCCAAE